MTRPLAFVALLIGLVVLVAQGEAVPTAVDPGDVLPTRLALAEVAIPVSTPTTLSARDGDSTSPDSAQAEFDAGRFWHAARILEDEAELTVEGRLLLARAYAGYSHWDGVLDALTAVEVDAGDVAADLWTLRAMALDETAREFEAEQSWLSALSAGTPQPAVAWARISRIRLAREALPEAMAALDSAEAKRPGLGAAIAASALPGRVESGDTAAVALLMARVGRVFGSTASWEYPAQSALAAGDTAGAVGLYGAIVDTDESATRKARALEVLGDIALARSDSAAAATRYLEARRIAPATAAGRRAARGVIDLVDPAEMDAEMALLAAQSLDRIGDGRRALKAYDIHADLMAATDNAMSASARLERARIAATVPARLEEAIEEFRALDEHPDPEIGARTLEIWAGVRSRQGRTGDVATLRSWLVERYPDTDQAASVVFLRADAAQDRGAVESALTTYNQLITMAPSRNLAGQARMRVAQLHLGRGEETRAAEVWESYLNDFPSGRRWEEAAYWAARIRAEQGDTAAAQRHVQRLETESPLSYYSVRAARLVGREYDVARLLPGSSSGPGANPTPLPLLDALEAAGLEGAADDWVDELAVRARRDGPEALLSLAEALNARGRTLFGINLGWELRDEGMSWSRRLVEVVYPFIYREMVRREAAEWGLDPILVAALIRQESAWVADIRSGAGAIGLMQVMPATGAEVARQSGMRGFSPAALETPEVNLHLGATFLRDLLERYGTDLPLVLSAYNAGPTRADRWRNFPEFADTERFTERIPFEETRGYVKNVTRNLELYSALYGAELRPIAENDR